MSGDRLARWRLLLGEQAEAHGISLPSEGAEAERLEKIEQVIGYLFEEGEGAEGDPSGSGKSRQRSGGRGASQMSVPRWVDWVSELFPQSAREILEKQLVQRRGIHQLLEQPDLLERIEPSVELAKTLLTHKDLIRPETRSLVRKVVAKVVDQLKDLMQIQVEEALTGALRRDRHSPRPAYRNLDLKRTVQRNLHNYDTEKEKLLVERVFYFAAERKKRPWHVIVCVDQSGSMLESAIFSTVMASIFHGIPALKTSLVLFDDAVVDLSDQVNQPVDVLLKVQLGGGTDITQALQYCSQLIREPARTILVLVSDFYEGRRVTDLLAVSRNLADSGVRLVGLAALGYDARPSYCKQTARKLRKTGMDILVCTPERLAECMGQIIRG